MDNSDKGYETGMLDEETVSAIWYPKQQDIQDKIMIGTDIFGNFCMTNLKPGDMLKVINEFKELLSGHYMMQKDDIVRFVKYVCYDNNIIVFKTIRNNANCYGYTNNFKKVNNYRKEYR